MHPETDHIHPHPLDNPTPSHRPGVPVLLPTTAAEPRMPPASRIHHAAAMGRLAQVQEMLAADPALLNAVHPGGQDAGGDPSDWAGSTPLVLAARYNQVGLVCGCGVE